MAWFSIVVVTDRGNKIKEMIEGDNGAVIKEMISRQYPKAKKVAVNKILEIPFLAGGVPVRDIVIFTRQFATMIDAGLPLVQCLDILSRQQPLLPFRSAISKIKNKVEGGSTFADALKDHPKIFDELYYNLVAAGETGGILDNILNRLSVYMEKADKIKTKVKSAMTFPLITLSVAFAVIILMLVWVFPIFAKMFSDFGAELPALTQAIIDLSDWLTKYIVLFGMGLVGLGFGFKMITSTEKGLYTWHNILLNLPGLGPVIKKSAVASFTRTLATMLQSGVPILDALEICAKTSGNKVIEKAIFSARTAISEGRTLTEPLKETPVFPSMVIQMIEVGEQVGALDTMLAKIADFYDEEVNQAVEDMVGLIEPVMVVFLGVVLGTLMVALYLPVFTMGGAIK